MLFMNVYAGNGGGSSSNRGGGDGARPTRKPTRDANQRPQAGGGGLSGRRDANGRRIRATGTGVFAGGRRR